MPKRTSPSSARAFDNARAEHTLHHPALLPLGALLLAGSINAHAQSSAPATPATAGTLPTVVVREQAEAPEEVEETSDEEPESEAESLTEAQAQQLFQMVGGEKAYQSMIKWAGQNLSQEEVSMYDSVMGKGDPNAIFFAVQALNSKYSDSVGRDGQMLSGKSAKSEDNSFQSQAQLVEAMSDPRYDSDPAYRRSVLNKLANSDVEF